MEQAGRLLHPVVPPGRHVSLSLVRTCLPWAFGVLVSTFGSMASADGVNPGNWRISGERSSQESVHFCCGRGRGIEIANAQYRARPRSSGLGDVIQTLVAFPAIRDAPLFGLLCITKRNDVGARTGHVDKSFRLTDPKHRQAIHNCRSYSAAFKVAGFSRSIFWFRSTQVSQVLPVLGPPPSQPPLPANFRGFPTNNGCCDSCSHLPTPVPIHRGGRSNSSQALLPMYYHRIPFRTASPTGRSYVDMQRVPGT